MPSAAPDHHCGLKMPMSAKKVSERAEGRAGLTQQSAQIRRTWRAVGSGDLDPGSNSSSGGHHRRGKKKGMLNWYPT